MTISLENPSKPNILLPQRAATWQDYLNLRDEVDWRKIAFNQGWLWADMEQEGLSHSVFSNLLTMIFAVWGLLYPSVMLSSYGRCLMEREGTHGCNPDLVIYKGSNIPQQQEECQWIDLAKHRVPDLVGEISDTTLSLDLDEQKQLYASLRIGEYWVIDVKGQRVFAFGLTAQGLYEIIETSRVLEGLSIALIEQTLERLDHETNTAAANWLMQQLQTTN
jgi:hypothetical protein